MGRNGTARRVALNNTAIYSHASLTCSFWRSGILKCRRSFFFCFYKGTSNMASFPDLSSGNHIIKDRASVIVPCYGHKQTGSRRSGAPHCMSGAAGRGKMCHMHWP